MNELYEEGASEEIKRIKLRLVDALHDFANDLRYIGVNETDIQLEINHVAWWFNKNRLPYKKGK